MATAGDVGAAERRVDAGVLVASSPEVDPNRLYSFARRMVKDGADELESATDTTWQFTAEEPSSLPDRTPHRPSEFLDESMERMIEGPYDLMVVVTDVPLVSRNNRRVAGLPSPVSRVVVISTRKLLTSRREEPVRSLDSEAVRWNAAALLLHLIGHVLGARHEAEGNVMAEFDFDPSRRELPDFDIDVERNLQRVARRIPEEEISRGRLRRIGFHLSSGVRNPTQVLDAIVGSRALLFPLLLPKLATAAITPTLVIVFSAEAWDVGFHLANSTAALFAAGSVLAAAVHLMFVQHLFFPRKRKEIVTEHMALVNLTVFLILVVAMLGLFLLVGAVIVLIEFVVFPPRLMATWPSLEDPTVTVHDRLRTAAFISTIGVLSGALAGGLENRDVLRHLALFRDRP